MQAAIATAHFGVSRAATLAAEKADAPLSESNAAMQ
jgi:hypothetical protein